ncbi:MAG: hypothetical protein IT486_11625 [Gammaproteobacteria bacterium]|nr:hypothetical protein [Gammaproteobacteria bacterium]
MARPIVLNLNAVILAVTADQPRVLTVRRDLRHIAGDLALPAGPLDADADRTLELALRRWIRGQTGIEVGYVEQLYTFADRGRDPGEREGGARLVSVAYLALVPEQPLGAGVEAQWQNAYDFVPWEDRRDGQADAGSMRPLLARWVRAGKGAAERRAREERIALCFGQTAAGWDGYQALERYELLYEAGAVEEAWRDRGAKAPPDTGRLAGTCMALDHRRILATALARVRGKLKYRPVVFELLPATFTLLELQRLVEALAGIRLHKQNFRRLVEGARLVEGTGTFRASGPGRPAERFRFRRDVLRERQGPGVRLPAVGRGRAR